MRISFKDRAYGVLLDGREFITTLEGNCIACISWILCVGGDLKVLFFFYHLTQSNYNLDEASEATGWDAQFYFTIPNGNYLMF